MTIEFKEISLSTPHLELAGLRWGNPDGIPVLAVHGWLDNAASFVPLAPGLEEFNVVAIDWPGHGHSQHRHASAKYYVIEFMWDIHEALEALGWSSCHLVGHSLGAAAAAIFSAASPDRVRSLSMIDSLGPIANQPGETAERLRRSMDSMRARPRSLKTYASVEDMIEARLANSDLSPEAARLITERSFRPTDKGFEWSYDPKLYWSSPVYFSEDQVLDIFRHIEAPALAMSATPLQFFREELYHARLEALTKVRHQLIEGGHHFHMEKPELVAGMIRDFIVAYDDPAMSMNPDIRNT